MIALSRDRSRHGPTAVRAVVDVDLPRPRDFAAIRADDRAHALEVQTLSLLHEEAMQSFAGARWAAVDFINACRRRKAW